MQLYYIRHAQSANNALWDRTGASVGRTMDPEVTDTGRKQAEILAHFISHRPPSPAAINGRDPMNMTGFGITHLYSSLMDRAVYTAWRMAEALNMPVYAWEDLHEEGGIYLNDEVTGEPAGKSGHDRLYFTEQYPRLVLPENFREGGWWNRPFETYELRRPRARRVYQEILSRHGGTSDRVALVSHGGFYNHFMAVVLGLPETASDNAPGLLFAINNCAITRIDFEGDVTIVIYQNRLDFLPGELIT
jgi:2,3-bisphosphoglycerate-dependent phosphoglycerate mutase